MPVQNVVSWFNAVLAGVAGGPRCPHRSAAETENRDSVNEAYGLRGPVLSRIYRSVKRE